MKAEAQEPHVLTDILAETRARMRERADERGEWEKLASRAQPAPSFLKALEGTTVAVIGEVKRRSPSAGPIKEDADVIALGRAYVAGGAAAISVLTEPTRFGGTMEDLMQVARATGRPTLRKDFIVDPIQVFEAKMAGAAAILLIVRALSPAELKDLSLLARSIGLATLVEVHSTVELNAAIGVNPTAIGVNARDLETLTMDHAGAVELLRAVPPGVIAVAESGLKTREDVERVAAAGADAVLVGTAIAGAEDPGTATKALVGVQRVARVWI